MFQFIIAITMFYDISLPQDLAWELAGKQSASPLMRCGCFWPPPYPPTHKTNPRARLSHGWAFYSGGSNGDNNGPQICSPASPSIGDGRLNRECQTSVICFPVRVLPPSFFACPDLPNSRQKGQAGFTRSSTTASASLPGVTPKACGCSPAYDFTARFPKIIDAVTSLRARSCVVDGEAIVVDERGLSVFDALRHRLRDHAAVLCAFDLIELDGEDLRWARLEDRKDTLATLLRAAGDGIAFNRHFDGDGEIIFRHACSLGCEGIVSKRLGSAYRSGRVNHWLKIKNPEAPAVRREAEEDWSGNCMTRGGRSRPGIPTAG
jgi:hypothetical protein